MYMRQQLIVLAALAGFGVAAYGAAPAFPTKPIRVIIPFAPGGASDFVGRIMQPRLAELTGQSIVVENRPGASGNIGLEAAAKSAPCAAGAIVRARPMPTTAGVSFRHNI